MGSYLVAMGLSSAIVLAWWGVQQASRAYHARHPEAMPSLESMGCHHCASASQCGQGDEDRSRCGG